MVNLNEVVQEMNAVKNENGFISFAEQASEMVYNADNYNTYYGAFNLAFEGFGTYENIYTGINIIETLELNNEEELKDFYLDLLDVAGLEGDVYTPCLKDFFTYNKLYSNVFYTKKFTIVNLVEKASKQFKDIFYTCFDYKSASFDLSKADENNIYAYKNVWNFFIKHEDMLNHLQCDEKLESIILGIFHKVEYAMEVEYSETLYNLENGIDW